MHGEADWAFIGQPCNEIWVSQYYLSQIRSKLHEKAV